MAAEPPPYEGPPPDHADGQRLDRLPPQAIEVERAVVGAMLLDGNSVGTAVELIDASMFYHMPHAHIYDAIVRLYERNKSVDQLSVAEDLKIEKRLDECGGIVYLAELAAGVSSAANLVHHCEIIKEAAILCEIIEITTKAQTRAYERDGTAAEILDWTERQILSIGSARQQGEPIVLETIMQDTFEVMERAHDAGSSVTGLATGFTDLDDLTSGFQPKDLFILAARPSVGKTALAMSFARNAAMDSGVGVAIFSLEMSNIQVAQRLLCIETRVDLHRLRTGQLRDDDWHVLTRNVGKLSQAPIYIDDSAELTVLEARAKARRLKREHGIGMVIIDYLQLMTTHEKVSSREQEVSRISRGLKAMAKELNIPVLALSQMSRASESRTDRRPQLSDLRESGSIEQDADVVAFIYRPDMYGLKGKKGASLEGVAEIIIGKQRNGPIGSAHLMWNAASASFENLAPGYRLDDEPEPQLPDMFRSDDWNND